MNHAPQSQTTGNSWRLLYLVGAAAVIAVLFFRRNCGAELTAFRGFGMWDVPATPPISAGDWFDPLSLGMVYPDRHWPVRPGKE